MLNISHDNGDTLGLRTNLPGSNSSVPLQRLFFVVFAFLRRHYDDDDGNNCYYAAETLAPL